MIEPKWEPHPHGGERCFLKCDLTVNTTMLHVYRSKDDWTCVGPGFFMRVSSEKTIYEAKALLVDKSIEILSGQLRLLRFLDASMRKTEPA